MVGTYYGPHETILLYVLAYYNCGFLSIFTLGALYGVSGHGNEGLDLINGVRLIAMRVLWLGKATPERLFNFLVESYTAAIL